MILGGVIISLGHVVLAISGMGELGGNSLGMSLFIWGLALIVVGTGHFKPCVTSMVGQLYRDGDPRRDAGFTIFYMGINLGPLSARSAARISRRRLAGIGALVRQQSGCCSV